MTPASRKTSRKVCRILIQDFGDESTMSYRGRNIPSQRQQTHPGNIRLRQSHNGQLVEMIVPWISKGIQLVYQLLLELIMDEPKSYLDEPSIRKCHHRFKLFYSSNTRSRDLIQIEAPDASPRYPVDHSGRYDPISSTGLTKETCDLLIDRVGGLIRRYPSKRKFHRPLDHMVHTTLYWMRKNPTFHDVSVSFKIPRSTAHRTIEYILPYLRTAINGSIPRPPDWGTPLPLLGRDRVIGMVDGTSLRRCRVHPGQHLYYRGDVGYHQLNGQILVSHDYVILGATIALGHNNDTAVFGFSGLRAEMEEERVIALADLGYPSTASNVLIRPESGPYGRRISSDFNVYHGSLRQGIENVNSHIKNWLILDSGTRVSPEMHAMAIIIICGLFNIQPPERYSPLRHRTFTLLQPVQQEIENLE